VVGTPGRVLDLATREKGPKLDLSKVKNFVLDECDRMLSELSMRRDVQRIFTLTPHEKQVMMFSATLDKAIRPICRKFCQDVSKLSPELSTFSSNQVPCCLCSRWKSSSMMIPSSPCMAFNSTSFDWKKARRIVSSMISWMHSSSTKS
jgi:hypothetical protein